MLRRLLRFVRSLYLCMCRELPNFSSLQGVAVWPTHAHDATALQVVPVHQPPSEQHSAEVQPAENAIVGVDATEADEQSQLVEKQCEHLTAGKSAFWDIMELYRRMCRTIVPLVLCNLLYYAMWSYCVPNLFCESAIKGSRVGVMLQHSKYRACTNDHLAPALQQYAHVMICICRAPM